MISFLVAEHIEAPGDTAKCGAALGHRGKSADRARDRRASAASVLRMLNRPGSVMATSPRSSPSSGDREPAPAGPGSGDRPPGARGRGEAIADNRSLDGLGQSPRPRRRRGTARRVRLERVWLQKPAKAASRSLGGTVAVEVLGFEIGDHRDRRVELEEGPVVLVRLADHDLAGADPGVGVGEPRMSADEHRGIEPGLGQKMADQRGGRGLAVGPGDGDAAATAHELAEHDRPSDHAITGPRRALSSSVSSSPTAAE